MMAEILQGDVLDLLPTLPAESVNCVVTSPPYFGLRDYGLPDTDWPAVRYAPMAGLPEITIPPMTCCLGLEDSIEAYVGHMVLVWREMWCVLRGDGVGWLNLGDSYAASGGHTKSGYSAIVGNTRNGVANLGSTSIPNGLKPKDLIGIPWRVALALQADGWYLRSDIIWHKPNALPESVKDRPTKAHEYLFLLAKSGSYWYDQTAIFEKAAYDGRRDTIRKGHNKATPPGQTESGISKGNTDRWPNKNAEGERGRNKRSVWSISTKPFRDAHFAVMPEALVETCLLAGCPAQVCAECGEPWVRETETETSFEGGSGKAGRSAEDVNANGKWAGKQYGTNLKLGPVNTVTTTGFSPTCQCSAPTRPGIVLDPFFGAGTVGVVAKQLGRDYIGIELNPDYAEMARKRLNQTQPALFPIY